MVADRTVTSLNMPERYQTMPQITELKNRCTRSFAQRKCCYE